MRNGYKTYRTIVLITTIVTLFVTIAADKGTGYEFVTFIPLVYLILFMSCKKMHYYSARYNGLLMLNGLMFLKYVIAILATCATKSYLLASYYAVSVSSSSYHWATLILIGEETAVFLTVELFSGAIYRNDGDMQALEKEYERVKTGPVIVLFLVASFGLAALYPSNLFGSISILFSSENQLTQVIETSHVLDTVFGAFKIVFIGLLINKCIVMYQCTDKKKYIIFSYILIALHCIMNVSTSRMNIIIPFVLFALITSKIYKKTGFYFNLIIAFALAVIIGIVSVYKMPWIFVGGSPVVAFFSDFTKRLQEYTSNIMPTAMGLQAIEAYKSSIDITTFFKDIFGVMPIVSHAFNEKEMIYTIYNMYAIGGINNTQLIPMTISSIAYFSPMFTYLLVISCTLILMIVEKKNDYVSRNYINDYLKLYLFFGFASCTFSNVQMIAGRLFTNYFPAIIVLLINQKLGRDRRIVIGRK